MANISFDIMGTYVAAVQASINSLSKKYSESFTMSGDLVLRGDIKMNGYSIIGAGIVNVGTLRYTTLDPPVSIGGNITGPTSSTNNAIVRYNGTTGELVRDSPITLSDTAQLTGPGGIIDMGAANIINLSSASVKVNSANIVTSASAPVVDSQIPIWSGTSGSSLKTSGIAITTVTIGASGATNLALARFDGISGTLLKNSPMTLSDDAKLTGPGGTMDLSVSGMINFVATNVKANGVSIATASDLGSYVQGPASAVGDNIATYNLTTGKLINDSGVAIGQIANKLPLAGGTMSGDIAMGGHNITNLASISGTIGNTRLTDNIMSNAGGAVGLGYLPVFADSTGKVVQDSTVALSSLATISSLSSYLPLSGGTMTGSISMGTHNLTNIGNIAGTTGITRTADNIVSNIGGATGAGYLPTFSDITGKAVQDSGVALSSLATVSSLSSYLPLAGGTMTGNIAMGAHNISNLGSISGTTGNTRVGDDILSCSTSEVNGNLTMFTSAARVLQDSGVVAANVITSALGGLSGNIPSFTASSKVIQDSGVAVSSVVTSPSGIAGNAATYTGTGNGIHDSGVAISSLATTSALNSYLLLSGGTMTGAIAMGGSNITGVGSLVGATPAITRAVDNIVSTAATGAASGNVPTFSATSKVIQDSGVALSSLALASSLNNYLPLTGGTMTGAIAMGANAITGTGANTAGSYSASLTTASTSTSTGAIVSAGGLGVAGNINAGGAINAVGGTMTGTLNMGANAINGTGANTAGSYSASLTTASTSTSTGAIVSAGGLGVAGNINAGGAINAAGGSMTGAIAMGNNAITGVLHVNYQANATPATPGLGFLNVYESGDKLKYINSSAATFQVATTTDLASYLPLAGGTMTGNIAMGVNAVTGTGANTGGSYSASSTTDSSSTTTGAITSAGGLGVALTLYSKTAVLGPVSTGLIQNHPTLVLRGISGSTDCPSIMMTANADTFPVANYFGRDHDNVGIMFDAYGGGAGFYSGSASSNFIIYKNSNRLNFQYNSGTAQGSNFTWTTAGYVDTSGILQWQKAIKTADTTASSSTSTGSIVASGGLGVAGAINAGGAMTLGGNLNMSSHSITNGVTCTLSDTCYVQGGTFPVSYQVASQYGQTGMNNTSALTKYLVSSIVFASLTTGSTLQIIVGTNLTCTSDTLSLFLYLNGTAVNTLTITGTFSSIPGKLTYNCAIGLNYMDVTAGSMLSGVTPTISFNRPTITPNASNTFDLYAQWTGSTSNNFACTSVTAIMHGQN